MRSPIWAVVLLKTFNLDKMKNFFQTFGAALLAFFVGTLLMWFILFSLFAGLAAAFTPKQVAVSAESVLVIDLESGIINSPVNRYGGLDFNTMQIATANTVLEVGNALELAAVDPNIKGIYLNFTGNGAIDYGNLEELRNGLLKFKESGKFIVAYNDVYSQPAYWLSSVADKVFINPEGFMDWRGMAANVMFYKGLLDKLDVDVQVIRHGTFKAAVEPFIMSGMSPENRLQMTTLVNSLWEVMVDDIAVSRKLTKEQLQEYAETMAIKEPSDAHRLGFVDGLLYRDQAEGLLVSMSEGADVTDYATLNDARKVNKVSLRDYITANAFAGKKVSKNKVAVIYAEGEIIDGESTMGTVGGLTLSEQIADARKEEGVKAVVLRVNSPGGSALASEVIWREIELCRAVKPVIVSMGGVAASGGYYIAAPADAILADRVTQTGSIGVFGMLLNLEKTLRDKVGITVDVVKTNTFADMGGIARPLNAPERAFLQNQVENTYKTFVDHVAAGRNMTFERVDSLGQGRVWLGVDAQKNGLVDGFGGLSDAIALAADRAGIVADFRVYEVLPEPDSFAALMSMFASQVRGTSVSNVKGELGNAFKDYNMLLKTLEENGVMARMPYNIEFN